MSTGGAAVAGAELGDARRLLYGRRIGHPLSDRQEHLLATLGDRLAVPEVNALDPMTLFEGADEVCLEIGFGGGEHLIDQALAQPSVGFIGAEPFVNGYVKAIDAIDRHGLKNVRLFHGDARFVLTRLVPESLSRIDLLYPDPWPKRRHRKRRFVGTDTLGMIARVLCVGGELRFASDIADYTAWTLRHTLADDRFDWTARRAGDWRTPWSGWSGTRYEEKAIRAGRIPCYLTFLRR